MAAGFTRPWGGEAITELLERLVQSNCPEVLNKDDGGGAPVLEPVRYVQQIGSREAVGVFHLQHAPVGCPWMQLLNAPLKPDEIPGDRATPECFFPSSSRSRRKMMLSRVL